MIVLLVGVVGILGAKAPELSPENAPNTIPLLKNPVMSGYTASRDCDIFFEDFESGVIPSGWTVVDANGDSATWTVGITYDVSPYFPPDYGTAYAYYSDDDAGSGAPPSNPEALITPVISIAGVDTLELSYSIGYQYLNDDWIVVSVRFDGGDWIEVSDYSSSISTVEHIDLTQHLPASTIEIKFEYWDEGGWNWAVGIDNVCLTSVTTPPPPTCGYLGSCGPFVTDTSVVWLADMAYNPTNEHLYLLEVGGPNGIIEWDPATCEIVNYITPAWGVSQRGLAYDAQRDVLYAGGWNEGIIYTVDPADGTILNTFNAPDGFTSISGLAYDNECDLLWIITNGAPDVLGAVDPESGDLVYGPNEVQWTTPAGYSGAGLAWGPPGFLLAVNQQAQQVDVLDKDGISYGYCDFPEELSLGWGIGYEWYGEDYWLTNATFDMLTHNIEMPSYEPFTWDCPTPPPPCPPAFDHLVVAFDFNESDQGFISLAPNPDCVNDWMWGPYDGLQPEIACEEVPITNYWGTVLGGNYSNYSGSRLMSGPIDVQEGDWLEICHWYAIESHWDGGNVKVSTDDGNTWTIISPCDGYPEPSVSSSNCLIGGEPAFSGSSNGWIQSYFDLSDFAGQTILIAFDFGSDGSVNHEGWYIKWARIWSTAPTDVAEGSIGRDLNLFEPKPNPTSGMTELAFTLPAAQKVDLAVYDASGRLVRRLASGRLAAGTHTFQWNGTDARGSRVANGIYFVKLTADSKTLTRKLILVK